MPPYRSVSYSPRRLPRGEMLSQAREFTKLMNARRSVRHFSADPVSRELIELAIATASSAPSGAHRQPWTFIAVSDLDIKREIRIAAESEERISYEGGRELQRRCGFGISETNPTDVEMRY